MKEKDDLMVLRAAAGAIDASAERNNLSDPSSSNEVVTTALLRKLWVRRMLTELGEQRSCERGPYSGGPGQSDDKDRM